MEESSGGRSRGCACHRFAESTERDSKPFDLYIALDPSLDTAAVEAAIESLTVTGTDELRPTVDQAAVESLKFSECLPPLVAESMLKGRMRDVDAVQQVQREPATFVLTR